MRRKKEMISPYLAAILFLLFIFPAWSEDDREMQDITDLTLEELLNVKIISASKFEESVFQTPATIMVISRQDIERRGYVGVNELLADLPGMDVIVSQSDLTQLMYSRGNSTGSFNERTMLLLDGVEANMLYTQHMGLESDFPLTAIERIEVMYGPASAVYGANAFSGVINIVTRKASELTDAQTSHLSARVGAGSFNTIIGEMTYLAKLKGINLSLSYRRFRSDRDDISDRSGYFANGAIIGNPTIWGPFAEIYPHYENFADDSGFMANISMGELEAGIYRFTTIHGNGSQYPFDKTLPTKNWRFFKDIYFLRYQRNITHKLHWNFLTIYRHDGTGPDSFWAQGWNEGPTWSSVRTVEMLTWKFISDKWTILSDFVFRPENGWAISGGLKYAHGDYQKGYEFGRADAITFIPGDTTYPYNQLFPQPLNDGRTPGNRFNDDEWGVYSQIKWSPPHKKVNVVLGARYDKNNLYGDTLNPRVGATWEPLSNLLLKANFGTAFQAPAPRNVYAGWGGLTVSDKLEPDRIHTVDLSVLFRTRQISHDVTFYYNRVAKSIQQGVNLPDKNIFGMEYKMNLFLFSMGNILKNTRLHFNYSFTEAHYDSPRFSEQTGRLSNRVENIARHKFNLIMDSDLTSSLHMNIRVNFVGKRPAIVTNPVTGTGSFLLTSVNLQYKRIIRGVTLYVGITNLFDVDYYHPGYDSADAGEDLSIPSRGWYSSRLPQPGRTFMLGIRTEL